MAMLEMPKGIHSSRLNLELWMPFCLMAFGRKQSQHQANSYEVFAE
jgi:hypothetical protein